MSLEWLSPAWPPGTVRRNATSRSSVRAFSILAWVAALMMLTGCGDQSRRIPVRGQVLYQDRPLEYGSVMFQPVDGGAVARGQIQSDGSFVLTTHGEGDGVQPGTCRVRITAFEAQRPGAVAATQVEMPLGESAIPDKYRSFGTSGIVIDVSADMKQPTVIRLE